MRIYTVRYREKLGHAFLVEGRYANPDDAKRVARIKACRPNVTDVKVTFSTGPGAVSTIHILTADSHQ